MVLQSLTRTVMIKLFKCSVVVTIDDMHTKSTLINTWFFLTLHDGERMYSGKCESIHYMDSRPVISAFYRAVASSTYVGGSTTGKRKPAHSISGVL